MRKSLHVAVLLSTVLLFTGLASAQAIQTGDYEMDWAILHNPVSSDMPTLEADTWPIKLENAAGTGLCPPTSTYVVRDAPASSIMGGSTTWCIKSDGTFDSSAQAAIAGRWDHYTDTHAIKSDQGLHYEPQERRDGKRHRLGHHVG
jgi:hypothetical protein